MPRKPLISVRLPFMYVECRGIQIVLLSCVKIPVKYELNGDIIADAPERYRLVWQDAGISYDKTDAVPKKNEQQITGIKDEVITKELSCFS